MAIVPYSNFISPLQGSGPGATVMIFLKTRHGFVYAIKDFDDGFQLGRPLPARKFLL
jgi:hypothetical protein